MHDIYKKAIEHYGNEQQLRKFVEELFVLGVNIMQLHKKESMEDLIDSIAETQIMIDQVVSIFELEKEVTQTRVEKLLDLAESMRKDLDDRK